MPFYKRLGSSSSNFTGAHRFNKTTSGTFKTSPRTFGSSKKPYRHHRKSNYNSATTKKGRYVKLV